MQYVISSTLLREMMVKLGIEGSRRVGKIQASLKYTKMGILSFSRTFLPVLHCAV